MTHSRRSLFTFGTVAAMVMVMASSLGCPPPAVTVATPAVTVTTPTVTPPPPPPPTPTTEEWQPVPISILYPTGGARLDDDARAMMREIHASMSHRTDIVRISVEGHADSRGTEEANMRLSLERAQGVTDFLVGELGMPRELFEVHGFGDERIRTSGTTAADRLQNRRVEFRILVRRQAAH